MSPAHGCLSAVKGCDFGMVAPPYHSACTLFQVVVIVCCQFSFHQVSPGRIHYPFETKRLYFLPRIQWPPGNWTWNSHEAGINQRQPDHSSTMNQPRTCHSPTIDLLGTRGPGDALRFGQWLVRMSRSAGSDRSCTGRQLRVSNWQRPAKGGLNCWEIHWFNRSWGYNQPAPSSSGITYWA